jgi:hypothetical protein
VKMITCHSEPERSEGEESRCYLTKESLFTRNETLRSLRSLRVTYGWSTRAYPVTCTTYSRSNGWRLASPPSSVNKFPESLNQLVGRLRGERYFATFWANPGRYIRDCDPNAIFVVLESRCAPFHHLAALGAMGGRSLLVHSLTACKMASRLTRYAPARTRCRISAIFTLGYSPSMKVYHTPVLKSNVEVKSRPDHRTAFLPARAFTGNERRRRSKS